MAEWQYRIERVELKAGADPDTKLQEILCENGQRGWELVQVLNGEETPDNLKCRLIFKSEKAFTDVQDTRCKPEP